METLLVLQIIINHSPHQLFVNYSLQLEVNHFEMILVEVFLYFQHQPRNYHHFHQCYHFFYCQSLDYLMSA